MEQGNFMTLVQVLEAIYVLMWSLGQVYHFSGVKFLHKLYT